MFGNRVTYTMSPGGVRRGLIWQSSTATPRKADPRNYLFDYRFNGTNVLPVARYQNSQIYPGTPVWWEWLPSFTEIREFSYNYPYRTAWTTDADGNNTPMIIASEYTAEMDIDAYFYPDIKELTELITTNGINYQQFYGNDSGSFKFYELMSGMTDSAGREYGAQMSCPFRIKGTMIYTDYYFDIYQAAGGAYNIIYPETIWDSFESRLAQIEYPAFGDFKGSSARGKGGYTYNFPFPSFETDSTPFTRELVTAAGEPNYDSNQYAWTKSRRILYTGLNNHYGLYISPAIYQTTGNSSLGDFGRYQWNAATPNDAILQHNLPGFDEVHLFMPFATGNDWIWPIRDEEGEIIRTEKHPGARPLYMETSGNYQTPGGVCMGTNIASRIAANQNNLGALRGSGIAQQAREMVPSVTIDAPDNQWIYGQFQPAFGLGTKMTVEISPAVASFRTRKQTTDDIRSGRFKYIGFKGIISFFEMPGE